MNNKILAISKFASNNTTRPVLTGVNVTSDRIMACDGFILGYTNNDIGMIEGNYPTKPINTKVLIIERDGDLARYHRSDSQSIVQPMIEGEYPQVESIIPQDEEVNHHTVTLGIATLEPLVKAMKAGKYKNVELSLPKDNVKPIKAHMGEGDNKIDLVIMPVKSNNK